MSTTIKQQITDAVLESLTDLTRDATTCIQRVRESNDLTALGTYKTELIVIFGPEQEQSRDCTGQTYQFDVHVKLFVPHPPPPAVRRQYSFPDLSAAVIEKLENCSALNGLATLVIGAEESAYLKTGLSHIKGPFIRIRLEYRRKRANPYETYLVGPAETASCTTQTNNTMAIS